MRKLNSIKTIIIITIVDLTTLTRDDMCDDDARVCMILDDSAATMMW
jgi:hypothetical protein